MVTLQTHAVAVFSHYNNVSTCSSCYYHAIACREHTLNPLATRYASELAGLLVAGLKACTSVKYAPKKYMMHRVECSNIVKICTEHSRMWSI